MAEPRVSTTIRTFLAALATVGLMTAPAAAQTTFGLRGGVSVADVDMEFSEVLDESNRTGFAGGVFLDFGRSEMLGFQVGAQYTQKGAELDLGQAVEDFDLAYLEIPVVAKLGLPLGIAKPSLLGGVSVGFNTECEGLGESDCEDRISSTELSGLLGADVAFDLGSLSLWVDGRYSFGLSDIADAVDVEELKNRAWTFQAGLGFPLGG